MSRQRGSEEKKEGASWEGLRGNCRATTPFSFHLAPNFKEEGGGREEEDGDDDDKSRVELGLVAVEPTLKVSLNIL